MEEKSFVARHPFIFTFLLILILFLLVFVLIPVERPEHADCIAFYQEPVDDYMEEYILRTFTWLYENHEWSISVPLDPDVYELYKGKEREEDYSLFVADADEVVSLIAEKISEIGEVYRFDKAEIPYLAASFVQSLPYTSDDVTTGFDDYTRFPYETIYENGGDCEDTSILTAALLKEMGYDVFLVKFSDHMGVAFECLSNKLGYYYVYENRMYCYLETTGTNCDLGELHSKYKREEGEFIEVG